MSSQAASAALSEARAFLKSAGILCATPLEIAFLGMTILPTSDCAEVHLRIVAVNRRAVKVFKRGQNRYEFTDWERDFQQQGNFDKKMEAKK
jgi:hypothetical protein